MKLIIFHFEMYYTYKGMNVKGLYSLKDNEMHAMSSLSILGNDRGQPGRACPPSRPFAAVSMGYGGATAHRYLSVQVSFFFFF